MTNRQRGGASTQPWLHQSGSVVQEFGSVRQFPLGLSYEARMYSCQRLNQTLADTQVLYHLYKKHHWLVRGATFFQLHELLDKHAKQQRKLIDTIAERVQTLGGVAVGDPRQIAEITVIPRPPDGVEEVPAMLLPVVGGARDHPGRRPGRRQPRRRTRRRGHQRPVHLRGGPDQRATGLVPRGAPRRHPAGAGMTRSQSRSCSSARSAATSCRRDASSANSTGSVPARAPAPCVSTAPAGGSPYGRARPSAGSPVCSRSRALGSASVAAAARASSCCRTFSMALTMTARNRFSTTNEEIRMNSRKRARRRAAPPSPHRLHPASSRRSSPGTASTATLRGRRSTPGPPRRTSWWP